MKNYFYVLVLCLSCFISATFLTGCSQSTEDAAVDIVNSLLKNNVNNPAKCTSVVLSSQNDDLSWNGTAKLNNGESLKVRVKRDGDIVTVEILE